MLCIGLIVEYICPMNVVDDLTISMPHGICSHIQDRLGRSWTLLAELHCVERCYIKLRCG